MTIDDLRRLRDLARLVEAHRVARYADEKKRSEAAAAAVAKLTNEIDAARDAASGSEEIALLAAAERWGRAAEAKFGPKSDQLADQRAIEDMSRKDASEAVGRVQAIAVIEREIARTRTIAARRKAEQEGRGTTI